MMPVQLTCRCSMIVACNLQVEVIVACNLPLSRSSWKAGGTQVVPEAHACTLGWKSAQASGPSGRR